MHHQFTTAKGWQVFIYVFSVILIGGGGFLLISAGGDKLAFTICLGVIMLLAGVYCVLLQLRYKLTVSDDGIAEQWAFRRKHIAFENIRGYRIVGQLLQIEATSGKKGRISINGYQYLANYRQLLNILHQLLPDLNAQDYTKEIQHVEHNLALGATAAERTDNLKQVRRLSYLVTALGIGISVWALLSDDFEMPVIAMVLYLFLLAGFFYGYKHMVTFSDTNKKELYPSLSFTLILSPLLLAIRLFKGFELLHFTDCLLPCAIVAVMLVGMFYGIRQTQEESLRKRTKLFVLIFGLTIYAFSITNAVNFAADKTPPQTLRSKILNLSVSHGKSNTYHVTLSPWGPVKKTDDVTVSSRMYYRLTIGQVVNVNLRKGYLNIPWYYIEP